MFIREDVLVEFKKEFKKELKKAKNIWRNKKEYYLCDRF
jgi:hypothetical protein